VYIGSDNCENVSENIHILHLLVCADVHVKCMHVCVFVYMHVHGGLALTCSCAYVDVCIHIFFNVIVVDGLLS
jgi:hypothetical protein